MQQMDAAGIATATGTSAETIRRLVDAGILHAEAEGFRLGDVARVRLVLALEASGVSLEGLGSAMRSGALSLDSVDRILPNPSPLLARSHADVAAALDVDPSFAHRVRSVLGTADAHDDDPVREDDEELTRMVAEARGLGAGENDLTRIVLVFADALRRIVAAQRDFIDEVLIRPYLDGGGSPADVLEATGDARAGYRDIGRRLLVLLHERLVEEAVFQNIVESTEAALAECGVARAPVHSQPAIVFVDQSGYTRMTEEAGDLEAAKTATALAEVVQGVAGGHGGRLVKLLGDGVMLHFPNATSAVRSTLEVRSRVSGAGLGTIHAGVTAGPVIRRDGDYFGSVVNICSRLADYAGPEEILVTREVVDEWRGGDDVAFEELGPASLKNVPHPVEVFRTATR